MSELFVLRDQFGRTLAQCTTARAVTREAEWLRADGCNLKFSMDRKERPQSFYQRYVRPWTPSKLQELKDKYLDGESQSFLEEYFDASADGLYKKLRAAGVAKRDRANSKKALAGGYGQLWLHQTGYLLELFEGGFSLRLISLELRRTERAIWLQLCKCGVIRAKTRAAILGYSGDFGAEFVSNPNKYGTEQIIENVLPVSDQDRIQKAEIELLVDRLHPKVKLLVMAIIAGDTLQQATTSAGLSEAQVVIVLPPLRKLLSEYLDRA